MRHAALGIALLVPCLASAQADVAVSASRGTWQQMTAYITKAAEELSEADYAYKPVATVRTFGQLIGHVAGAQYMFCAAALGDPPRDEGDVERTKTTKAALVEALKASTEYCRRAYAQTDAVATTTKVSLFGQQQTRLFVLTLNATHNGEHYGNIVTYMRMKGLVPPSSR
jgi:uncharacterized damage-inducible protein DinB